MTLIRRFPLKPLRDDREHSEAVRIIEELIGHNHDRGTSDYLDTLILLTNKYEDERHTPAGTSMSPQEVVNSIMSANHMTQAQMAQIIGSESALSMFLAGERSLSKSHIKALVGRFHVDAALFL